MERKVLEALQEKISRYGDESEIISHEAGEETVEILTAEFTRFGEHLDRFRKRDRRQRGFLDPAVAGQFI